MKVKRLTRQTSLAFTEEQYQQIIQLAEESKLSIAAFIRGIIEEYLQNHTCRNSRGTHHNDRLYSQHG